MKNKSMLLHSGKMFLVNIKTYSMLAISIVLSFAILLGYMIFSDSIVYNKYKSVLASPINAVLIETQDKPTDLENLLTAFEIVDPKISNYMRLEYSGAFPQYGERIQAKLFFSPNGDNPIVVHDFVNDGFGETDFISDYVHEIEIVKGTKQEGENDAIVCESFYNQVLKREELPLPLITVMQLSDGSTYPIKLNVVGICKDSTYDSTRTDADGSPVISGSIYCKQDVIAGLPANLLIWPTFVAVVATEKPAEIIKLAENRGYMVRSVYAARGIAIENTQSNSNTKMWIAIILYLILGVNLFGCFENALEKRKFEISVRRALGASRLQVINQFFLEGIMVMSLGILVSATIITVLAALFKLYLSVVKNVVWTIYITQSSMWIYIVCGFSMSALFSVIFAFRATNIEIVKNIKGD